MILLAAVAALATSVGSAQCVARPSLSFNGQVKISYPKGGGGASVVQFCDAAAQRFKQDFLIQSKKAGYNVKWVEYYRVANWVSTFHDSIYQTRALGFQQQNFKQFTVQNWRDMETVVYGNSSGKYVGMISRTVPGTKNTSEFVLYGN
ncbi:hypothetical protein EHF33_05460 [Deinococcus psychrotolerans]|uniref:Uncharacterized protein n=1 Tax=Deinococcus psychrotolerans TaxID=2489213 RepID=A0A3G8YM86_9DEIO|nr:hypothetical protein [Deinococcus psychrotolerans]AZI42266.1 hypothetical protein EHF33_05460 [Deinococcus psychrotolerans]